MSLILSIETSTKNCSVALVENSKCLFFKEESADQFIHSERLHVFLEELFLESGKSKSEIQAVAVGKGPGSYTGLRIGVSSAKGLCYALGIPLLAEDSLKILANQAIQSLSLDEDDLIIPVLDARRMEVYCQVYTSKMQECKATEAKIIDEESFSNLKASKIHFVGDALEKIEKTSKDPRFVFHHTIKFPNALSLGELSEEKFAQQNFEDIAYFEPWYFKDFIAGKPKKLV